MTTVTHTAAPSTGGRAARWAGRNAAVVLVFAVTAILVVGASFMSETFRDPENFVDILRQSIPLALATIGQLFVMLAGGTDMSVGMIARVVGLGAAVAMTTAGLPPYLVLPLGLAVGALLGLINGAIVARFSAQPFILTLGTMGILYGVALAISDGPTKLVPVSVLQIYEMSIWSIPLCVLAMGVVWLIAWWALARSHFGRATYAVGGSPVVARLAGLNSNRVIILCYVLSGLTSAAAGLFLLARSGVGNPTMAIGLEFQSIVAAAIGGISLYGGRGSILGAFGAVLLVTVISNLFDLFQFSAYWQNLALGVIVVLAVAIHKSEKPR